MNNEQFRRLVSDTPARVQNGESDAFEKPSATPALGSRNRASIPMTPRTVRGSSGIDFARQLAERNASNQPSKKFRSAAAPKGSKLAAGYRDRTQDRTDEEADDMARRIKALEESMKLGQIERETFEKLRDNITGGDVSATHLVKGLDWKLLERVRRGENVMKEDTTSADGSKEPEPDVDEELEKLEDKELVPVAREQTVKRGEMAPPPPVAGMKRSRDAILAELKAARKAAAEAKAAAQPQLGAKFRKIGQKKEPRIEVDDRGRDVLITVDEDGSEKRKVRKVKSDGVDAKAGLLMPDKETKPLGMEVPDLPLGPPSEDEDDDIFEGAGVEYDPLAGLEEDSASSSDEDAEDGEVPAAVNGTAHISLLESEGEASKTPATEKEIGVSAPQQPPLQITAQNYFNEPSSPASEPERRVNPLKDPAILAALAKARREPTTTGNSGTLTEEEERLKRRAAMLSASDRDMEDMDMGFGSSRFGDAEDVEEGGKMKFSQWRGTGAGSDDGENGKDPGGKKRKRGAKKRKGDKDSAADVLKVMERQKAGGS